MPPEGLYGTQIHLRGPWRLHQSIYDLAQLRGQTFLGLLGDEPSLYQPFIMAASESLMTSQKIAEYRATARIYFDIER